MDKRDDATRYVAELRKFLQDMTKAYDCIENAKRGVNTQDIHQTKTIPVYIGDLIAIYGIDFKIVLKEIENYPDERVRNKCMEVLRVRQSEKFRQIENITLESVMKIINDRVKEMNSLEDDYKYKILSGKKWAKIDSEFYRKGGYVQSSGWLMVNMHTGDIHKLLGYGKVDPEGCIGNILKMGGREIILAADPWKAERV